ncbi:TonB-dependent receptor plug domain-containing protein [Novosphingobium sp. EMRT-2]|uniref:TonB-dependent receptor plug domain-containing protein n=1 Tax=Novosphingobium sp. EMRT-2 TaxID=2571749 RepID=UPI0021076091|nr:TonB-dependent receptor plug domain-containing protein [Novosphingobium sp. EMRT-2]
MGYDDFRPNGNPSAAVSIDGAYQGSAALVGGQMFDVERIEILKGPQGTLYGQNTTAGAVNIISRQPTDTWEGEARVEYGRFNSWRAEAGAGALWPMASSCGWRRLRPHRRVHDQYRHARCQWIGQSCRPRARRSRRQHRGQSLPILRRSRDIAAGADRRHNGHA